MKRLDRPVARYRRDLTGVLEPHERMQLAAEVDVACAQAIRYRRHTPRLIGLTSRVINQDARQRFLALYESNKEAVVLLKDRVRDKLDKTTSAVCQYCGISEPGDLDHFVEKAIVPELVLYLPNLIPCCPICNRSRGKTFAADGTRRVLHFYDDDIDRLPDLLKADIEWPSGMSEPAARFSLQPSKHPLAAVYSNHFATLGLAKRYRVAAAKELDILCGKLRGGTVANVTAMLHTEISGAAVYGANDYRAALYRAIIAAPAVLAWVAQP